MLTRWYLYVLDYGREVGISCIMNLIVSHQSLLNARVCLLPLIEQQHFVQACALSFQTLSWLVPDGQKVIERASRKRERNKAVKGKKKNKSAFVKTKAHWAVSSLSSELVPDNGNSNRTHHIDGRWAKTLAKQVWAIYFVSIISHE